MTDAADEEPAIDIHKPKPWHGFRGFFKEYLIIVVGVLTALGAEQAVEAIHTSKKAAEAEDLVREEFARNVAFAQERALTSPCALAQYDMVERLLIGAPMGQPVPAISRLISGMRPYSWRQYESAVASGAVNHFPTERRLAYQRIFTAANSDGRSYSSVSWNQDQIVARLSVLTLSARVLDAATRERLLEDAAQVKAAETFLARSGVQITGFAAPLNLPAPKFATSTRLSTPTGVKQCVDRVAAESATLPLAQLSAP